VEPEKYRRKAKEFMGLATTAKDAKARTYFEDLAQSYLALAGQIETWQESRRDFSRPGSA
jgi:hypothetical protein